MMTMNVQDKEEQIRTFVNYKLIHSKIHTLYEEAWYYSPILWTTNKSYASTSYEHRNNKPAKIWSNGYKAYWHHGNLIKEERE